MKELDEVVEYLKYVLEDTSVLTDVERILRLIYMSEIDELVGAKGTREFQFRNCTVSVRYGR